MIIDGELVFSSAQALTTAAATPSTNVVDMTTARNVNPGSIMKIHARVNTTFTSGGAGTLTVEIQGSIDASAWTTMAGTGAYALASLVAGRDLISVGIPGPIAGQANPRYIRVLWTVGTAAMTAGKVDAMMVLDTPRENAYAAGINISN